MKSPGKAASGNGRLNNTDATPSTAAPESAPSAPSAPEPEKASTPPATPPTPEPVKGNTTPTPAAPNAPDLSALRVTQDYSTGLGVKKARLIVPVRKPA